MNKPNGYEEAQVFELMSVLPAGGYKCIIKKAVCETAKNGKEFLKLNIDIAEGEYAKYYEKKFTADTRDDKKWSGVWVIFTEGYEDNTTNPKYKGLITAIERSNPEFVFGHTNEKELENKKAGIVFREEEFVAADGRTLTSTKPFYAVDYAKAEEAEIPKRKKAASPASSVFETVDDYEGLPF